MKIDKVYFQCANPKDKNYEKYGTVLHTNMIEGKMHFRVQYLNTSEYDFVPVSDFGTESNSLYWICSYAQTQS